MIDYQKIFNQNMLNVFKDVLKNISENRQSSQNQLFITFLTNHESVQIPNWLLDKYPDEITIVIQYEYYNLKINMENFQITLSFDDIKADLTIGYESIISFGDPNANFGLKLQQHYKKNNVNLKNKKNKNEDNIIEFSNFKKN